MQSKLDKNVKYMYFDFHKAVESNQFDEFRWRLF